MTQTTGRAHVLQCGIEDAVTRAPEARPDHGLLPELAVKLLVATAPQCLDPRDVTRSDKAPDAPKERGYAEHHDRTHRHGSSRPPTPAAHTCPNTAASTQFHLDVLIPVGVDLGAGERGDGLEVRVALGDVHRQRLLLVGRCLRSSLKHEADLQSVLGLAAVSLLIRRFPDEARDDPVNRSALQSRTALNGVPVRGPDPRADAPVSRTHRGGTHESSYCPRCRRHSRCHQPRGRVHWRSPRRDL
ncbi:hypothetical protein [Streptodolium elevatio]|uniref:Uncharacterized protein n=1 Tax=Streptodolium elevatio TaxID=3157996 RepID=A0ABV3DGS8_9ACTN